MAKVDVVYLSIYGALYWGIAEALILSSVLRLESFG